MNKIILLISIFFTTIVFALSEDVKQPIEIEAESVIVDEISGFNEFSGNAEVRQGSLLMTAELIQVQTNTDGVETMKATGTVDNPAKYIQSQENQARFIEATATLITYDVNKGMIFLTLNILSRIINRTTCFHSFNTICISLNLDKLCSHQE